jgi:hypothetical protein
MPHLPRDSSTPLAGPCERGTARARIVHGPRRQCSGSLGAFEVVRIGGRGSWYGSVSHLVLDWPCGPAPVMRSFKTKGFARFAKREGLPDTVLCMSAEALERGLIGADLGGGVVKAVRGLARASPAGTGRSRCSVVAAGGVRVRVREELAQRHRRAGAGGTPDAGEARAGDELGRCGPSRESRCALGGAMR